MSLAVWTKVPFATRRSMAGKEIGKIPDDDKEVEVEKHVTFTTRGSVLDLLLRRYSSWLKLQTLLAWLMRFVDYIANENGPLKSVRISRECGNPQRRLFRWSNDSTFLKKLIA